MAESIPATVKVKSLMHSNTHRSITSCLILLLLLATSVPPARSFPVGIPKGTTLYDPSRAYDCYVLFTPLGASPAGTSTVYLINMNGKVVHSWETPGFAITARLLPNGNLLYVGQGGKMFPGRPGFGKLWIGGAAGVVMELTWDGQTVFKHEDPYMHHDSIKLPNGNYLYLTWEPVPQAMQAKVRGGKIGTEFPGRIMFNDCLVEVNKQGKEVWRWHANPNLDPDTDIIGPVYAREEWLHTNGIAAMPDGNILLTSRSTDALLIVNRKTGKVSFRWGNTSFLDKQTGRIEYRHGPKVLGGPHGGDVIAPGLPGAGNIICYDNGVYRFISRGIEINPATKEMVSDTTPRIVARKPFTDFLGSAQRLPNGNTLLCEGANGRFYQQAPDAARSVVWEYLSDKMPVPMMQAAVYKIHGYDPHYCKQFASLDPAGGEAVNPPTAEESQPNATPPNGLTPVPGDGAAAGESQGQNILWIVLAFVAGLVIAAVLVRRKQ